MWVGRLLAFKIALVILSCRWLSFISYLVRTSTYGGIRFLLRQQSCLYCIIRTVIIERPQLINTATWPRKMIQYWKAVCNTRKAANGYYSNTCIRHSYLLIRNRIFVNNSGNPEPIRARFYAVTGRPRSKMAKMAKKINELFVRVYNASEMPFLSGRFALNLETTGEWMSSILLEKNCDFFPKRGHLPQTVFLRCFSFSLRLFPFSIY